MEETIKIVRYTEAEDVTTYTGSSARRGPVPPSISKIAKRVVTEIPFTALETELQRITGLLSQLIDNANAVGAFPLSEVTFRLEIGGSGELGLLGSSVTANAAAGIELKFVKSNTTDERQKEKTRTELQAARGA